MRGATHVAAIVPVATAAFSIVRRSIPPSSGTRYASTTRAAARPCRSTHSCRSLSAGSRNSHWSKPIKLSQTKQPHRQYNSMYSAGARDRLPSGTVQAEMTYDVDGPAPPGRRRGRGRPGRPGPAAWSRRRSGRGCRRGLTGRRVFGCGHRSGQDSRRVGRGGSEPVTVASVAGSGVGHHGAIRPGRPAPPSACRPGVGVDSGATSGCGFWPYWGGTYEGPVVVVVGSLPVRLGGRRQQHGGRPRREA